MVAELQAEAEKVTGLIQLVHEKVRQSLGSTRLMTLEHISSKLVENLKTIEAKVRQKMNR